MSGAGSGPSTDAARRAEARDAAARLHAPVLRDEAVAALDPARGGLFLDGTFGAGGYTRALLEAGADRVLGLDRDPEAILRAEAWAALYAAEDGAPRLILREGRFGELDAHAAAAFGDPEAAGAGERVPILAGVALDIGVSSMQIDQAERGFSFQQDGPLDMRMGGAGPSARDLVNDWPEARLADLFWRYGEERSARRVARAVVEARATGPIESTRRLAEIIEASLPQPSPAARRRAAAAGARGKPPHPATRAFQALRIAVNDELGELTQGLAAAERALAPGGVLAVVTFHSLEDRIVKRFLQERAGKADRGSRHQPEVNRIAPSFELIGRGATTPSAEEIAANPRARSAKLRAARRTEAAAVPLDPDALGAPRLAEERGPERGGRRGRGARR